MKLLFVTQHYWPEPFNSTEIAEELAARGHDVTVLTGIPNYPEGEVYPGYDDPATLFQRKDGVSIVRAKIHPRHTGALHRVWNYYSFARKGEKLVAALPGDFDAVLSFQTSPVMQSRPAIAYARRTGAPLLLYCIDIWPECLTAGGIKPGSAVYNHYKGVSRGIYSTADRIAVTSPLFIDYLRDTVGVPLHDPLYLPQFAEDMFGEVVDGPVVDGYDPERLNLTFAGNVGAIQGLDALVRAAALLADDGRFAFHVVGGGTELENLKALAAELGCSNVTFHGRHELDEMPAYYAASDAMVATFAKNPVLGLTLPRKIQSYLAAGRPVVGALVGEARRVVDEAGCGFCCEAGDAEGLADACRRFASCPDKDVLGARAREYYEENYSRARFFDALEAALNELKGTRHGS